MALDACFPLPSRGPLEHVKQSYIPGKEAEDPRISKNFRIQPKHFGNNLTSSLGGRLSVVFSGFCRVKKWTPGQSSGLLMQLIFGWTALSGATDRGVDVGREPKI